MGIVTRFFSSLLTNDLIVKNSFVRILIINSTTCQLDNSTAALSLEDILCGACREKQKKHHLILSWRKSYFRLHAWSWIHVVFLVFLLSNYIRNSRVFTVQHWFQWETLNFIFLNTLRNLKPEKRTIIASFHLSNASWSTKCTTEHHVCRFCSSQTQTATAKFTLTESCSYSNQLLNKD